MSSDSKNLYRVNLKIGISKQPLTYGLMAATRTQGMSWLLGWMMFWTTYRNKVRESAETDTGIK
jgi:hypothetical protein